MKWVVCIEGLVILWLAWMVWRLSTTVAILASMVHRYRIPSATSSTAADRVSYTTPLHKTESLGPIE